MISEKLVRDVTVELLRKTVTRMTDDVVNELKNAMKNETEEVPRMQLKAILDNLELAEKTLTPLCQDTGVTIFYVNMPRCLDVDVEKAIVEGVRTATKVV